MNFLHLLVSEIRAGGRGVELAEKSAVREALVAKLPIYSYVMEVSGSAHVPAITMQICECR